MKIFISRVRNLITRVIRRIALFVRMNFFTLFEKNFPYKGFLCIYAQFKNEKHALREWVEHYIAEGADHIFLVDNSSTDNYDIEYLQQHPDVTLLFDKRKYSQRIILKEIYRRHIENKFRWVFVCDLDEFLYAKNSESLPAAVKRISQASPQTRCIAVPWKMFGSNGHIKQPESIIEGFTRRNLFTEQKIEYRPDTPNPSLVYNKCLFKTSYGYIPDVHIPEHALKKMVAYPHAVNSVNYKDKSYKLTDTCEIKYREEEFNHAELQLNHYPVQSLEFFEQVKMTRGDSATIENETVRNFDYFYNYDTNFYQDKELFEKKMKYFRDSSDF